MEGHGRVHLLPDIAALQGHRRQALYRVPQMRLQGPGCLCHLVPKV